MTKVERAKRQSRRKFRGVLKLLPNITKEAFLDLVDENEECGFCQEYRAYRRGLMDCGKCRVKISCRDFMDKLYSLERKRYWRKGAEKLCGWALREVNKVKADDIRSLT